LGHQQLQGCRHGVDWGGHVHPSPPHGDTPEAVDAPTSD